MELANHSQSGFNLNICRSSESTEEEIPLRPPRRSKESSKNQRGAKPKQENDEPTCLNELIGDSITDANRNQNSYNYEEIYTCDRLKPNSTRILSDEADISKVDSQGRISTLVESDSFAQTGGIKENIDYQLEESILSKEYCNLTVSNSRKVTFPVDDSNLLSSVVSKYEDKNISDGLTFGSRMENNSALLAMGESDDDSFCSIESGEDIEDEDKIDVSNQISVENYLKSSNSEPVTRCFLQVQSFEIRKDEAQHNEEVNASHSKTFNAGFSNASCFPAGHESDNKLQHCSTESERRNFREERSAETGDQSAQTISYENSRLQAAVSNKNSVNGNIHESNRISEGDIYCEKKLQIDVNNSSLIDNGDICVSSKPNKNTEGGSGSSDSESTSTSSEAGNENKYAHRGIESGQKETHEDEENVGRKMDTVTEILSAFKHTEYLSTDDSSDKLESFGSCEKQELPTALVVEAKNIDKSEGENDFDKYEKKENVGTPLSPHSKILCGRETHLEDHKNKNDFQLNHKVAEESKFKFSAAPNEETFERDECVFHWKFNSGALKSPVETIPEEAEESYSRDPSRVGSLYFESNQAKIAETVTETKTSANASSPELQILLKVREKLFSGSSFGDFISSSVNSPTIDSRTPLTSLSGNSSQNDEVFDTYFGTVENTVRSPIYRRKSSDLEFVETHFEIHSAKSEPILFSQDRNETERMVLWRVESLNLKSPGFRRRTAGFSQKRRGNPAKIGLRVISDSPTGKSKDVSRKSELESPQASLNYSENEDLNPSRSVFYRSLPRDGDRKLDADNTQKNDSVAENACQSSCNENEDSNSESSGPQMQLVSQGEVEQKTDSEVNDKNNNGMNTAAGTTIDSEPKTRDASDMTDKKNNNSIANRRKTLQKMRTKWATSYDIDVAQQRRLSSEMSQVDITRITKFEAETKSVEDEKKKNTEIELPPTRPPRHKKNLKYSKSFATSRTNERRGGNRNKSERRGSASRWRTISTGVDALTTPDKWRISLFGPSNFQIPIQIANHGPLTLVTDQIPAISTSFPTGRRAQVVQELYETEITYVRILETVIEIFKKPLEEYLGAKDIETMFVNINDIFKLNKDLLFLLCERVTHWTSKQLIGDVFVNMSSRFKIYAKFCSHYDAAESLIKQKAEKRKDFDAFLNECYNDPICQPDQNLQAHLIAVVQRIPRYIMLLGRLLERTPKSHPDYPHLEQANSKMTGIAEYINNQLEEFQGQKAMMELRARLIGIKAFLTPDRWRIKEGDVSLMSPKKLYKLLLFNDLLVFVAKGASKQSEVELTMDLKTVWFADLGNKDPQATKQDAFELYNPESSYTVYCGSRNEKRSWLQKLRTAVAIRLHGPEATEEHDIVCRLKSGFTYKDGRIYCGQFIDGKREGQGLMAWPNRNRYQGNWEDDERNGIGEMTYNTGDKYHGEWCDDREHGIGTIKYSNGDFYTGEWREGQMHGKGMIGFNNKDRFDGQFVHGEIKGVGTLKCVSGLRYEGKWQNSKKHGKGKLHYPNGDDYNGDFQNDQKHGRGEMIYADQSTYLGEWVNDWRHNSGVFSSPDGTYYDGEWNKDLITGRGKMVYSNGDEYNGTWFRNQRFGRGVLKYHHGDVYQGEFDYNLMCGKGIMQYRNGGEYVGDWKAGQRSGSGKMIFSDGGVYEGEWEHDLRKGKGKMAFPNGSTYEGRWENDKQHGTGTFSHLESNYCYEGSWRYGKKDGKGVETTPKSTYDGSWKENMRHGYGKETLKSGTVLSGHWKENRKHGKVSVELRTGDVKHGVFEQMWQDGQLVEKSETVPIELPLILHGS